MSLFQKFVRKERCRTFQVSKQVPASHTERLSIAASRRLRIILWIATLFLVFFYIGGQIHSAYEQTKVKKSLVTKAVLMTSAADRVVLESTLNPLQREAMQKGAEQVHSRMQAEVSDTDVVDEGVRQSAPFLLFVLIFALLITSLVFWLAEQKVIKPFVEIMRKRERDAAVAQIVHMLAHDIRKPFTMMSIVLKNLRTNENWEESRRLLDRHATSIELATTSVTNQLNDLLVFGHDSVIRPQNTSIANLFESSFQDLAFSRQYSKFSLLCEGDTHSVLELDQEKMRRVFDNLISNAMDASGPVGHVVFSCESFDDTVHVRVVNPCQPIPEERLERIFEPFYTFGKSHGTGLGLAIVQKFVEAHGGHISCRNVPGFGVSFEMSFPRRLKVHGQVISKVKSTGLPRATDVRFRSYFGSLR